MIQSPGGQNENNNMYNSEDGSGEMYQAREAVAKVLVLAINFHD